MRSNHKILGALWYFQVANYTDRVAISFAGPLIMSSLSIDAQSFGLILSSFGLGYALAQLPGGMLADRWSAKGLLVLAPLLWALLTGLTGLMVSVAGFFAVRACLGLAEGLSNGACFKVIGDNFDSKQRTGATAISGTAHAVGPALIGPMIGFIMAAHGWQPVFFILMLPPLVAAAINYRVIPAHQHAKESFAQHTSVSLLAILRFRSLWMFVLVYFLFNIAFWGYNGWMPTYLALARHIDIKHIGILGGIPYVFSFSGMLIMGWLGMRLHRWREALLAICLLLAATSLYVAFASDGLFGAMAGLCGGSCFINASVPLIASLILDSAPPTLRASYSGVVFTAGQIGGIIAPFVIGTLVKQTGNFGSGFAFMEASLVAGAIIITIFPRLLPSTAPAKEASLAL